MEWTGLLNEARRQKRRSTVKKLGRIGTEFERDYDRLLFSTPTRRLADKTQVFPLERNDSIRTRLTHSLEVSTLARDIGSELAFEHKGLFEGVESSERSIPALLSAVGLAHDFGNPPFGHEGEEAMRRWFKNNQE